MAQLKTPSFYSELAKKIFFVFFAAITNAIALNNFLIPARVYGAGLNGVSQLLSSFLFDFSHIEISTGLLIMLFNIPIALLGWYKVGRDFTLFSFLTVALMSIFSMILPIQEVTNDPIMNAIVGGVISGVGVGLSLKYGFSTGGMDIVSMVLAKTTGRSIGTLMFGINFIVISLAGFAYGWEYALYTLLSIYVLTKVVDTIHTSHQKVTAMIVTQHSAEMTAAIKEKLIRGITLLPAKGGFSGADSSVLMVVVTRYELYDLEQAVKETDPFAFVNILQTNRVIGEFWDSDRQKSHREETKRSQENR
ncbi:putative integral membrane protein [Carnobacterium maltaromaticum]|uniref:YitT family protein n=1 Tax=Carnobacterium maltaromaticum TaxID=2751 RepID=UPI00191BA4DB|nr:YitT family protein [Carnobacterium maltaromaticum]CAD5899942.1 putative integral membrane protein [Carnobacterium maltaromaticum]